MIITGGSTLALPPGPARGPGQLEAAAGRCGSRTSSLVSTIVPRCLGATVARCHTVSAGASEHSTGNLYMLQHYW